MPRYRDYWLRRNRRQCVECPETDIDTARCVTCRTKRYEGRRRRFELIANRYAARRGLQQSSYDREVVAATIGKGVAARSF